MEQKRENDREDCYERSVTLGFILPGSLEFRYRLLGERYIQKHVEYSEATAHLLQYLQSRPQIHP